MKLIVIKNKKYLQQKFSQKVLVPRTTAGFYVEGQQELRPFYMLILYGNAFCADSSQALQVKTNFYVFSYDKTSLKFCTSFRFFLSVFLEKIQKICYLNYVRRRIE